MRIYLKWGLRAANSGTFHEYSTEYRKKNLMILIPYFWTATKKTSSHNCHCVSLFLSSVSFLWHLSVWCRPLPILCAVSGAGSWMRAGVSLACGWARVCRAGVSSKINWASLFTQSSLSICWRGIIPSERYSYP